MPTTLAQALGGLPWARVGRFNDTGRLELSLKRVPMVSAPIDQLKAAWKGPLAW